MNIKVLIFSSAVLVSLILNPALAKANYSEEVSAPEASALKAELDADQDYGGEDLEVLDISDSPDELQSWLEEIESENAETVYVDEQGNEYYLPAEDVAGPTTLRRKKRGRGRGCVAGSGEASWYGPGFHGRRTANGERFNQNDLTAAHKTLKFGTRVRVTYKGRSVIVRINDAGPFVAGRVIDLSKAAAQAIGLIGPGHGRVTLDVLSCG